MLLLARPLYHRKFDEYTDLLKPLEVDGRPTSFPTLGENEAVICGSEYTSVENMEGLFQCPSLPSMQAAYDRLHIFLRAPIRWYICSDLNELIQRLVKAFEEENNNC